MRFLINLLITIAVIVSCSQIGRNLHAEGKLTGAQKLFFHHPKPPEELFDLFTDPHEVNNLADSPKHSHILKKMRVELERWIAETGDLGGLDEEELIERMWPGRKQPITAAPAIKTTPAPDGKIMVKISCTTEGASVGYRIGNQGRWLIYSKPILLDFGAVLQAKAIRLGYKESEMARLLR